MWKGFTGNLIRRTNQHWLIWGLILLACVVLYFGYGWSYFSGFLSSPRATTTQQLTTASSPSDFSDPFVSVTSESTEPTGFQEIRREGGQASVQAAFVSAVIGGRRMLIRVAPEDVPSATVQGSTFSGQIKRVNDLRNRIVGNYAPPDGSLLPIYLDTYQYRASGYAALALAIPVLLVALWMLQRWLQVSADSSRHSLGRGLSAQGDLETLVPWIDSNMAAPHATFSRGSTRADVSQHWLIVSTYMGGAAMQISSIVWVHRSLIKRRLFFAIPVGRRYLVNVYDQFGQRLAIQLSEAKAQELFEQLRRVTPNAIHGFNRRLFAMWRGMSNKTGLPEAAAAMLGGETLPEQRVTNQYGG
jgi:hypothetical protein